MKLQRHSLAEPSSSVMEPSPFAARITSSAGSARFVTVSAEVAERYRLKAEHRQLQHAKYNATRPNRANGKIPMRDRPFIAWDGEGPQDTGYSLLGNSLGTELCHPRLRTRECLELLMESATENPYAINVGFGFNYDVSSILGDLPWRCLVALHSYNRTLWDGYRIEHIPRKWFRVAYGNTSFKVFDVHSFFASSLTGALEKWKIGPWQYPSPLVPGVHAGHGFTEPLTVPTLSVVISMTEQDLVVLFKKLRSQFLWKDIAQIAVYMRLELKYTVQLMEALRDALALADYVPRSWHGPGSVARMAFKRHDVYGCLVSCPDPVKDATRRGFVAGRFESVIAGLIDNVYAADLHSAYPWFCSHVPNLARGKWRHVSGYEECHFGIFRIEYAAKPDAYRIYPLPKRDKNGMVSWPYRVSGWYWNPEARLVCDDPDAKITEGWVFDEDDPLDRPFAWLREYYAQRDAWKKEGNAAEYTYKLIINSGSYGLLAGRAGWDRKKCQPPRTHQLEYAGWITSSCRAAVYLVGRECGDDLISIDTDGVMSMRPFTWLTDEDRLGGWELTEYEQGIFWQSGIYFLKNGNEWEKAKSRGIPKGTYTPRELLMAYQSGEPLRLVKKQFNGYGISLNRREKLNTWEDLNVEYAFGGSGKRYHPADACARQCNGDIHRLASPVLLQGPFTDCESYPHRLPWIDAAEDMQVKKFLDDLEFYDLNDDTDNEWSHVA